MDIPVSRLNNRMALQLPAELPLGLVFVVGEVTQLQLPTKRGELVAFHIREGDYYLRCRLTPRAANNLTLNEGHRVRAGGHLAFDSQWAHYYLLARDLEVIGEARRSGGSTMSSILEDVKRRSEATALATADLPPWVKRLAPPEVKAELKAMDDDWDESIVLAEEQLPPAAEFVSPSDPAAAGLTEELFSLLSEAMDSEEEVELTPEILAGFAVADRVRVEDRDEGLEEDEVTAVDEPFPPDEPPVIDEMPVTVVAGPETVDVKPPSPETTPRVAAPPDDQGASGLEYLFFGLALGVLLVLGILVVWFLILGL